MGCDAPGSLEVKGGLEGLLSPPFGLISAGITSIPLL